MALTPSPPRTRNAGRIVPAKGVLIDSFRVRDACRDETVARRSLADFEAKSRTDVEFLVAVGRSAYRQFERVPATCKKESLGALDIVLFDHNSPPRVPHRVPEHRQGVLKSRPEPLQFSNHFYEEAELRNWLARLETKMWNTLVAQARAEWTQETRFVRCEATQDAGRRELITSEAEGWKRITKRAFVEKPYFDRVPPPPRELTFDETEETARGAVVVQECEGRNAIHDWLVLRYGVQLFGVNRVEDIYRQEIENAFDESWARVVQTHFYHTYSVPTLAMVAFHTGALRSALVNTVFSATSA
jgi:hypothetical protein